MPGFYTHYLGADEAYNALAEGPLKELLTKYKHVYEMGAQGPDVFNFYKPFGKNRDNVTRYSTMLHERQVDQAIRAMVSYMMDQMNEDRDVLAAYLMGYITHYAIDSSCNAYVNYRAGFVSQGRGDPVKFKGYYNRLRTELDYLLTVKLTGKKPNEIPLTPHVEVDYSEMDEFCRMYPVVLKKVYGKDSIREYTITAYQKMYEFSKELNKNSFLSKLKFKLAELIKKNKGDFTQLFYPKNIKDLDQLNENGTQWTLPWDNRVMYTTSYMELYKRGVDSAVKMIEAIYQAYIGNGSDISVVGITGGNSMATGVKWNSPMVWKFYDLIYEPGNKSFE